MADSTAFEREQAGRAARGKDHEAGSWCQRLNCTAHPQPPTHEPDAIYVPICTTCGGDLVWIEDLQRWEHADDMG